jgi:hypothetical protein
MLPSLASLLQRTSVVEERFSIRWIVFGTSQSLEKATPTAEFMMVDPPLHTRSGRTTPKRPGSQPLPALSLSPR